MKRLCALLLIALTAFSACKKELPPELELSSDLITADASGCSYGVTVTANYSWTAESDASWVSLSNKEGEAGSRNLIISVSPSQEEDERRAYVTVNCQNLSSIITIIQAQNNIITVSASEFKLGSREQSFSLAVISNVDYKVEIPEDCTWLTRDETKGCVKNTEFFKVQANEDYSSRETNIRIYDDESGQSADVHVIQLQKDAIFVDPETVEVGSDGGSFEIEILYNVDFVIKIPEGDDWLSYTETKSLSSKKFTFTVEENPEKRTRIANVRITGTDTGLSQILCVEQAPYQEVLIYEGETQMTVGPDDSVVEIKLRANCEIASETSVDWLSIKETKATEDRTYYIVCQANAGLTSRQGKVTFTSTAKPDLKVEITIDQEAFKGKLLTFEFTGKKCQAPTLSSRSAFNARIDWGDGSEEAYAEGLIHKYAAEGSYRITITSVCAEKAVFADVEGVSFIDPSEF